MRAGRDPGVSPFVLGFEAEKERCKRDFVCTRPVVGYVSCANLRRRKGFKAGMGIVSALRIVFVESRADMACLSARSFSHDSNPCLLLLYAPLHVRQYFRLRLSVSLRWVLEGSSGPCQAVHRSVPCSGRASQVSLANPPVSRLARAWN